MTLGKETKVGLTFGQIIATFSLLAVLVGVWVSLNIKVAQAESRIKTLEMQRIEDARRIEKLFDNNRADHLRILNALDRLIDKLDNKADKQNP